MRASKNNVLALCCGCLGCVAPVSAVAEEHEVEAYSQPLLSCYEVAETAEARKSCKGQMSALCSETEEGGFSTYGMVRCVSAETKVWDRLLNEIYQEQLVRLREMDTDEAQYFPDFAKRSEALRDAQRAWITFRDAECGLAYAMWGSGSMRRIAGVACHMEMTADRVVELESLGDEMR